MAKITKTLSAKIDRQTKKAEILFRFVGSSTLILRAKSGIYISPDQWNEKKGELKTATFGKEQAAIKIKLNNLCDTILDTFASTPIADIDKRWLNMVIDKFHYPERYQEVVEEVAQQSFFETFDEFLSVRKLSEVRKRNFRVIYRALQRYELYIGTPLDLDSTTDQTLRDIDKFLREEHTLLDKPRYKRILKSIPESREPQPKGQNTINDIFTKLRTFWLWAIEEGKTTNLPKIKIESCVYGTPFYISTEERKQIERTNLSRHPSLAIQRDIFVFQCCVGCRVGDLYKLTLQNVIDGAIQYVPRKTKDGRPVTVTVPLSIAAGEIVERYSAHNGSGLLPFISEQKYNVAIKRVFRAARINRVVMVRNPLTGESEPKPLYEVASSHLARRTFVGNMYKRAKDPNLVGAMSGHKEGSKAFARYRDIDDEMKRELISFLD